MAITAKVHTGRDFFLEHVARLNRSVTLDAFQSRLSVRRVAKEDKIRNSVDRHPRDLLALLRRVPKFRDLRTVGLDRFVTLHAEVNRRNRCIVAFINSGVAKVAGKADVRRMRLMTERDRLRSNRLGKLFLFLPRSRFLSKREDAKQQADQQHASEPKPSTPVLRLPKITSHFVPASPLGNANATILPVKTLSYLLPPPAGITTNCLPDFFPM
jgi:hypothetical protein